VKYTLKGIRPGYAVVCVEGVSVGHVQFVRAINPVLGNTGWHAFVNSRRVGPTLCHTRARAARAVAEAASDNHTGGQMKEPEWPKHPDGTPKKMGELTPAQQREQFQAALRRLKPEFANMGVKLVEGKDH